MANSSGTATYNATRTELIQGSFRLLRVLREGDVPNSAQTSYAVSALQMLIKNLESEGLLLWTYYQVAIPLIINQRLYTIGPSGADVTAPRPIRLFDGSYVNDNSGTSTDLIILSRQAYFQITNKTTTGLTNSIYYLPGIDIAGGAATNAGTGFGSLYVYFPVTASSQYTCYANFMRPLYDMTNATDGFDFPQEWFRCLKFMLAADMACEYDVDPQRMVYVTKMADQMHQKLLQWNRDQSLVAFGEERSREERARDANTTEG